MKQFAVPESGERKRNFTTLVLVKKSLTETRPVPTEGLRVLSESAQMVDVVHHNGMVPEGEAQPDNPEQQVLLEVQKSQ